MLATDLDFVLCEYAQDEPLTLIEYKYIQAPFRADTGPVRSLAKLATRAAIPGFLVRWKRDPYQFYLRPLNTYAEWFKPPDGWCSEQYYVAFLKNVRRRHLELLERGL